MRLWDNEKARFLIVGAVNTGIGYLSFATLYLALGTALHYMAIAALAHCVAVSMAFLLQRRLVFRSSAPWRPEFVRYNISVLGVLAASMAGLSLLVSGLGLHPLAAQAAITSGSVLVSYFSHRRFSFRRR